MQLLKPYWIAQEGHPLFSIDIHPDGTRFATGGQGADSAGRICIWNMAPVLRADADEGVPRLLSQMDHHLGCVNCLRWSNSGTMLASGGDDKLVMIWKKSSYGGGGTIFGGGGKVNVESWRCVHTLRSHSGDVLDLAWSPGDRLLATASVDNTVIVWNGEKLPEMITTLRGHSGLVKGVVFDPVGKYLASQSDDKSLRVWRISDWHEETVLKEPFLESGATTHVLRPGWSPDGSMLVSAHAMNEGGPTAQIIDRTTWKTERDFVGHKKAISCVRFNSNILQKTSAGANQYFVAVALGSRDRSFSVWSTNLKRPFLVITDLFDQSVLDISWSRDGRILMACSMDGTVAAMLLSEQELGRPLTEEKMHEVMTKSYGKNFGLPTVRSKKQTNGTVIVENPNLLRQANAAKAKAAEEMNGMPDKSSRLNHSRVRNPTDKQIEARTSDGKRRITPIFIPPNEGENLANQAFGSGEFGSSSTQEKSRIEIEKRDDIVKPNVSPGKTTSEGKSESGAASAAPKGGSAKVNNDDDDDDMSVNLIQVRRKPKPPLLDSSDDDEGGKEDGTNAAGETNGFAASAAVKKIKPKESALPKPNLVLAKRKPADDGDESPRQKKRGRPPMNRSNNLSDSPSVSNANDSQDETEEDAAAQSRTVPLAMEGKAVLPPLKIEKPKSVNFQIRDKKVTVHVVNNFQTVGATATPMYLHLLKFQYNSVVASSGVCKVLLSSAVSSVNLCSDFVIVTCQDSTLNIFSAIGERLFPPMMLPSPLSKIAVQRDLLAAITTSAKFFQWTLTPLGPKVVQKDQCVLSLLQSHTSASQVKIDRLSITSAGHPLIVTSVGKSYIFNPDFGTWLRLTDNDNAVYAVSNYSNTAGSTAQREGNLGGNLPLALLGRTSVPVRSSATSVVEDVPPALRSLANVSYSEMQSVASKYLGSSTEYRFWLLQYVKHLTEEGNVAKLREVLDFLVGPVHSGGGGGDAASSSATSCWEPKVLSLRKDELLPAVMNIVGSNLELQRLHMEYQEQMDSKRDIAGIEEAFQSQICSNGIDGDH